MNFFRRNYFTTINNTKDVIEKEFLKLDYYSMLQVKHSSSLKEIRKNYVEMAKLFHPDRYKGPSSIFKRLSEGYNTLKDPSKREDYNKKLKIFTHYKYKNNKDKKKVNSDIYGGLKSKYEEDFNKINIDLLFSRFRSIPIKNDPKNLRVNYNLSRFLNLFQREKCRKESL